MINATRGAAVLVLLLAACMVFAHHSKDAEFQRLKVQMDHSCALAEKEAGNWWSGRSSERDCKRHTKYYRMRKGVLDAESAERKQAAVERERARASEKHPQSAKHKQDTGQRRGCNDVLG